MNTDKLKAKLEKADKGLQPLLEKKKELDKKIKEKQEEISLIKSQITQAEFSELQSKLDEKGVSLDELKKAIETQDFSSFKSADNKPL